jgi:hypothetical protein
VSAVAIPPGLYVNAHELIDHGPFHVWRAAATPQDRVSRRRLAARSGVPVFVEGGEAWYLREPVEAAPREPYLPADRPGLHRAAIREGLRETALESGFEAWFGFRGEVHCAPVGEPLVEDGPVRVDPVLRLKVVGVGEPGQSALVVRFDAPWRFSTPVGDPAMREVAVGERALRIGGDGPRSGRVEGFDGDRVVLRAGGVTVSAAADAYALAADPPVVQRMVPDATRLVATLEAASRSLLPDGRPNQYALQERQQRASHLLARMRPMIAMPGGGSVEIEPAPLQVKVRDP